MLGRIHGSVEHFYVPKLVYLEENNNPEVSSALSAGVPHNLFSLGWDAVDAFKKQQYTSWVDKFWKNKFPPELAEKFPATLPPRYDAIVKSLVFAVSHDYMQEIKHFTQLYYLERHRVRKFDTVIRDMCHGVAEAAIGCAFKLLSDCVWDIQNKKWLREHAEVDKPLIACLLRYKFWREATGSGLVWYHSEFDELERLNADVLANKYRLGSKLDAQKRQRCLDEIKTWERDHEKFRDFVTVGGESLMAPSPLLVDNEAGD